MHLTPAELAELDAALHHAMRCSTDPLALTVDDYPLDELAHRLAAVERELINGRGFVRLRGIDRSAGQPGRDGALTGASACTSASPRPEQARSRSGDVTDQSGGCVNDLTARGTSSAASPRRSTAMAPTSSGLLCLENGSGRRALGGLEPVRIHNRLGAGAARPGRRSHQPPHRLCGAAAGGPTFTRCPCSPSGTAASALHPALHLGVAAPC